MKKAYKNRIADRLLARKLAGKGAVLLEGAKWCGKTTTAEQIAKSVLYMSETGKVEQNKQLAKINPAILLQGDKPRLIDEWHKVRGRPQSAFGIVHSYRLVGSGRHE